MMTDRSASLLTQLSLYLCAASLAATVPGAAQSTLTVGTGATFATIQSAIVAAASGDQILVGPGVYFEDIDFLGKSLSIISQQGAGLTVIDGSTNQSIPAVVIVGPVTCTIEGFTITDPVPPPPLGPNNAPNRGIDVSGGAALALRDSVVTACRTSGTGGGIRVDGASSVTVQNCTVSSCTAGDQGGGIWIQGTGQLIGCTIRDNRAGWGGGVFIREGTITNCLIRDNVAESGGALGGGILAGFGWQEGPVTISDCQIIGNVAMGVTTGTPIAAAQGGGLFLSGSEIVERCEIRGNIVTGLASMTPPSQPMGGGVYCTGFYSNPPNQIGPSSPTIRACVIAGNTAASNGTGLGGGIAVVYQASPTVVNCEFSANAAAAGGALGCVSASPRLVNCTIAGNAASVGAALFATNGSSQATGIPNLPSAIVTVGNTIVWNHPQFSIWATYSNTLALSTCNVEGGWPGSGNIDAEPFFVASQSGNLHIGPLSACIDAGDPTLPGAPVVDIDGDSRTIGAGIDIGADEYSGPLCASPNDAAAQVLTVGGSTGAPGRSVEVSAGSPVTLAVAAPVSNSVPARFVIYGTIGVPDGSNTVFATGVGTLCFLPAPLYSAPWLMIVADSFAPNPAALFPSTPAPWSYTIPAVQNGGFAVTLQGFVETGGGGTIPGVSTTNAVVVRFL